MHHIYLCDILNLTLHHLLLNFTITSFLSLGYTGMDHFIPKREFRMNLVQSPREEIYKLLKHTALGFKAKNPSIKIEVMAWDKCKNIIKRQKTWWEWEGISFSKLRKKLCLPFLFIVLELTVNN